MVLCQTYCDNTAHVRLHTRRNKKVKLTEDVKTTYDSLLEACPASCALEIQFSKENIPALNASFELMTHFFHWFSCPVMK